jgi:prevent-host-death family protein
LFNMKTATLRQLRHEFGTVLALVEQGEPVEITKRGKPIAVLTPPVRARTTRARQRPDFAARLRRIYGDMIVPGDVVVEERQSRQT